MSYKHISINELTNIEANFKLGIKARECAITMQIGKDKVYKYYKMFIQRLTVIEIYNQYQENRKRCGRKYIKLSEEKLKEIDYKLDFDWSLDATAAKDNVDQVEEKCSTKTLYNMVKRGLIDMNKLRRKGKRNPNRHNETRGKINVCKTIHECGGKYPKAKSSEQYGRFEGDTIGGEKRKSAVVILVEKKHSTSYY